MQAPQASTHVNQATQDDMNANLQVLPRYFMQQLVKTACELTLVVYQGCTFWDDHAAVAVDQLALYTRTHELAAAARTSDGQHCRHTQERDSAKQTRCTNSKPLDMLDKQPKKGFLKASPQTHEAAPPGQEHQRTPITYAYNSTAEQVAQQALANNSAQQSGCSNSMPSGQMQLFETRMRPCVDVCPSVKRPRSQCNAVLNTTTDTITACAAWRT